MNRFLGRSAHAKILRGACTVVATLLLAACGGGGGGGGAGEATATSVSVSPASVKYSQSTLVTVNGSNLDAGLAVTSPGCKAMTLSTTPPNLSTASTAYYTCTASGVGDQSVSVKRTSDGASIGSAGFNVPMPQVTLTVSNGFVASDGTVVPPTATGTMAFTLAPDKAPVTVDNFLAYVKDDFYVNTIFHRVHLVPTPFVIQGGGYRVGGVSKGLFPNIPLEVNKGLSNVQWSVAMARSSDPDSANSQFFINLVDNHSSLDPAAAGGSGLGYAVFGAVTTGIDVVAAITSAPCAPLTIASGAVTAAPECTPQPFMVITSAVQTQ